MFKYKCNTELFLDEYDSNGIWNGNTIKIEKDSLWTIDEEDITNGELKIIQKTDTGFNSIEIDDDILTEYFTSIR